MLNKDKIKEEFEKKFNNLVRAEINTQGRTIPAQESDPRNEILAHLSAQYEKLIEEVMLEERPMRRIEIQAVFKDTLIGKLTDAELVEIQDRNLGFNICLNNIRTSLQERGINIK